MRYCKCGVPNNMTMSVSEWSQCWRGDSSWWWAGWCKAVSASISRKYLVAHWDKTRYTLCCCSHTVTSHLIQQHNDNTAPLQHSNTAQFYFKLDNRYLCPIQTLSTIQFNSIIWGFISHNEAAWAEMMSFMPKIFVICHDMIEDINMNW